MSEEELQEIRAEADRHRVTVSHWVRQTLREARRRGHTTGVGRVREGPPDYASGAAGPSSRVRVEMELKPDLMDAVRERYHLPSRRAAVEYAL